MEFKALVWIILVARDSLFVEYDVGFFRVKKVYRDMNG